MQNDIYRTKNLRYKTLVQKKLVKSALRFFICEIAEVVQMVEIDLLSISAITICRSWTIMLSVSCGPLIAAGRGQRTG